MAAARPIDPADRAEWLRMRAALHGADESHERETRDFFDGRWPAVPYGVLVVPRDGGGLCGYIEVGERSVAESCESSPVAYVESWWVDPDVRGRGVGAALMAAAEQWARARGHVEIASDTQHDNALSIDVHHALGFEITERLVTFRKTL